MPTHQLCSSRMWSKGVLWIGVGMPVFAGGWETSRKWSRDFLLFTLLCSLVLSLQHVDRLAWISHEPSFESENFLKLDWPSRWSTVISSRSHLQVMPCVCHPSPWWPWPRTSFINVTWIAQAGWRKRIRMLNLRERSPPFGAGCLSRTRAYHGLLLPNAHQIGCNWCILYTVSLIIPESLEKALMGLNFAPDGQHRLDWATYAVIPTAERSGQHHHSKEYCILKHESI